MSHQQRKAAKRPTDRNMNSKKDMSTAIENRREQNRMAQRRLRQKHKQQKATGTTAADQQPQINSKTRIHAPRSRNPSDLHSHQELPISPTDHELLEASISSSGLSGANTSMNSAAVESPNASYSFGTYCLQDCDDDGLLDIQSFMETDGLNLHATDLDLTFPNLPSDPLLDGSEAASGGNIFGASVLEHEGSSPKITGSLETTSDISSGNRSLLENPNIEGVPTPTVLANNSTSARRSSSINIGKEKAGEPYSGWVSSLHIAAQRGHDRIVRILLQHDIDCNESDSDGLTPLIHATIGGYEDVVISLISHGARIDKVDNQHKSALHWAVLHRRETLLKVLLNHCNGDQTLVDNYDSDGRTPLHTAIDTGFEAGVQVLLQYGANVHYRAKKKLVVQ